MPIAARAGFASTSSCIDRLGGEFEEVHAQNATGLLRLRPISR